MFYSEQLLSKTGPLARVWLASNVERKLSKSQILQSDIQSSIGAIVDQGQAPMALRLSGQLMLGVVRIYGRKARYLLDDCNETLLKIRMTFKTTNNNDLPNQQGPTTDLNLPDILTVEDLFPSLDLSFPLTQVLNTDTVDKGQNLNEDWTSSLAPKFSNTQSRLSPEDAPLLEDDPGLILDIGDDTGFGNNTSMDIEIQIGRNDPFARPLSEDPFADIDKSVGDDYGLAVNVGGGDANMTDAPALNPDFENADNFLGKDDGLGFPGDDDTFQLLNSADRQPQNSRSLLSDNLADLDATFANVEEETQIAVQQPQRNRKKKLIVPDIETVLHNKQIKAQAEDRSKIIRPAQFLPKDPFLLTLMNMSKNGDFVSNVMLDGRSKNWAPELQGLLSFEAVRMAGSKRKRDSGIADLSDDGRSDKSPRLNSPENEEGDFLQNDEGVDIANREGTEIEIPGDNAEAPAAMSVPSEDDNEGMVMAGDDMFDETTMPLLHPAESGPVSLGTKHAVHLLRDRLGGEGSSHQAKKSVLLQDLVPEGATSKEDATKMFFEVLVLATKDAIKVEQSGGEKTLGMPLRIRGKRGLWGSWAETELVEALETA